MTFDEFVRTRLPALLGFTAAMCADRATAEDVVQEVLARVSPRWREIGNLDRPEAYVRRMLVNEYLSWRRKWARITPVDVLEQATAGASNDPTTELADRDELVAEIARLPRRQRAVIAMRFFADMNDTEIAHDLGCSAGTVRSHASRALAALRVRLEDNERSSELR